MVMLQATPLKSNGGLGIHLQVPLIQFPFPEQNSPPLKQAGGGGGRMLQAAPEAGGVQLHLEVPLVKLRQFPRPEQKRPLFKQGGGLHWKSWIAEQFPYGTHFPLVVVEFQLRYKLEALAPDGHQAH